MAEHLITDLELGRSRTPTAREAIVEQLVRGWLMSPHGDRRDGAKSVGIEAQKVRAEGKNHIVRVFILRDDLHDLRARRLFGRPVHQISQRLATAEGLLDVIEDVTVGRFDGAHWNCPHGDLYETRRVRVSWPEAQRTVGR